MENQEVHDFIVIGGGISGVSFTHYLQGIGIENLLLEKNNRLGGQIESHRSEKVSDFWSELGSHTCYNSYKHLLALVSDIDYRNQVQELGKGSYVVYKSNKIRSVFSQMKIFQLAFSVPKIFFSKRDNKTVKEYFRPIVGKQNYDKLFTYLFRAVICQFPDNYPVQLFLKRRNGRNKDFPRKFSFKNGLEDLIKNLVSRNNIKHLEKTQVLKIEKTQDNIFRLSTNNGIFHTKNIALATDPHTSSNLLQDINSDLSALLGKIELSRSTSINIRVEANKINMDKVAGIIAISGDFMSAVSRDLIEEDRFRSFTFHFENNKSEDEKMEIISKVLGIKESDILEIKETKHILPSLKKKDIDLAGQIASLEDSNIYILGNYFYGLSLEDCVNRSLDEFERYKNNAEKI